MLSLNCDPNEQRRAGPLRNLCLAIAGRSGRLFWIGVLSAAAALSCLGLGCGVHRAQAEQPVTVVVAGSTSVQPVAELLAEAFMAENRSVRVVVQGGGSSAGVRAVQAGAANIAACSRELTGDETRLERFEIALDAMAVVVNPANPISNIESNHLRDIYSGRLRSWEPLGGAAAPMVAVTRESGSGTRSSFEESAVQPDSISPRCIVQNSSGAVAATVAQDPNAIGYISFFALGEGVKPLSVDGVEPAEENVATGKYKLSRPFIFAVNGKPEGPVKDFIDFVTGPEGIAIIRLEGLVVK